MKVKKNWFVYILQCKDGTLYTGMTTDLDRRLVEHKSGMGAKYTRSHRAEKIVYSEKCKSRSEAGKREAEIKRMPKSKKIVLIS